VCVCVCSFVLSFFEKKKQKSINNSFNKLKQIFDFFSFILFATSTCLFISNISSNNNKIQTQLLGFFFRSFP
jgi:hypothetical protein